MSKSPAKRKYRGGKQTRTQQAWSNMKSRCYYPRDKAYKHYGGRGIKICDEWVRDFGSFLRDMGEAPSGYTLERKDVNSDYCKENCTWIPAKFQNMNTRRTRWITFSGITMPLVKWATFLKMRNGTIAERLDRGLPTVVALGYEPIYDLSAPSYQSMSAKGQDRRGERNGRCKLTTEDVIEIRALLADGVKPEDIAKRFPISVKYVARIKGRHRWAHI